MTYQQLIERSIRNRQEEKAMNKVLGEHNLTIGDFMVAALVREGYDTATPIAKKLDTSLAFVTNRLNAVEKTKLVKRVPDKNDQRNKRLVFIGDEGKFKQLESALEEIEL